MENQDQQALNTLQEVCRLFKGTLDEHQAVQTALQHVRARLTKETAPVASPS